MKRYAFFLTAHGFGHGVRASALINALPADSRVSLYTGLPKQFFEEELRRPFHYHFCEIDCGCIQPDSMRVDIEATLKAYAAIDERREDLIPFWSRHLRENGADMVIGDIPPLAFPIARAAGLKSAAICNFGWHDIYAPYVEAFPAYRSLTASIQSDYALCDRHFRLEPYFGSAFSAESRSVGLLARLGRDRKAELAHHFALNPELPWALVYLGSHGLPGMDWSGLSRISGWQFFGLYDLPGAGSNYRRIEKTPEFDYADLTASSQVLFGKLGYGLISEAIAHGKPVIFPGRTDFGEFECLKSALVERGLGREIPTTRLNQVDLRDDLHWALQISAPSQTAPALNHLVQRLEFEIQNGSQGRE